VLMSLSAAPAGSRTVSTGADLIRFVRAHLADGLGLNGTRVLSAASALAMREEQVARPSPVARQAQGLGWLLADWDGVRVVGHGGGTIGQLSFLQSVPEHDLVVVLLTNGPTGGLLWRDLGRWLFDELAGVHMPGEPKAADPVPDLPLEAYAGTYERLGFRYTISVNDGQLQFNSQPSDEMKELETWPEEPPRPLLPISREAFVLPDEEANGVVSFHEWDQGRPGYLFTGRMARRVS
jgi:hypothetical protein